jgi:hypothetical protein
MELIAPAQPRLVRYRALLGGARFDPLAYFGSFPAQLPFRLGESQADATVPYVLAGDLIVAAEAAAAELLDLLKRRKEGEPPPDKAIFLEHAPRRLPPARLYPGRLTSGSFVHAVATRALRADPLLDAGLVEAWLGKGAAAAGLIESLHALLSQALEADLNAGATTPYLYVVALTLAEQVEALKRFTKTATIKGLSYDRLEKALGLLCFFTFDELLERLLAPLPSRQLPFETASYAQRVRMALNPLGYVSIRKSIVAQDLNAYSVSAAWAARLDPLLTELLAIDPDPRQVERKLEVLLQSDASLRAGAEAEGRVQLLREATLGFLGAFDAFDPELTAALVAVAVDDKQLATLGARTKELATRMAPLDRRKLDVHEVRALSTFRAALRGDADRPTLIRFASTGFLALALDRFAAVHLDAARARMRNRRAELQLPKLEAEYQQGRLYRFGPGKPFFRAASVTNQGHLFIDLKGFTQRTYRAKEVVMADFMRVEFYAPLLRAAGALMYEPGVAGPPRLTLQNLLGDAAVFSGDVRALVRLARDIQLHLAGYAEKLRAKMGNTAAGAEDKARSARAEAEEKALHLQMELSMLDAELARKRSLSVDAQEELLWDLYARRAFQLERKRSEAELAGLGADAERLRKAETMLAEERGLLDAALEELDGPDRRGHIDERICAPERARKGEITRELASLAENTKVLLRALEEEARSASGFGLEAGLFVAYGAMAERVEIDDREFGLVKVAIAEKINEAARGTARAGPVRAKLDAQLEKARTRRPQVELPFSVYVDQSYSVVFSPELTALVDAAVSERDPDKVREAARLLADGLEHDVNKVAGLSDARGPGLLTVVNDIYNVGEAFSVEAVEAFLKDTRSTRFAFKKGLSISELHPELRERFLFTSDTMELIVSVPLAGELTDALIFRLAGHVHFRGFEAKKATAVYELLRPSAKFTRGIMQAHLRQWLNDARASVPLIRPATKG